MLILTTLAIGGAVSATFTAVKGGQWLLDQVEEKLNALDLADALATAHIMYAKQRINPKDIPPPGADVELLEVVFPISTRKGLQPLKLVVTRPEQAQLKRLQGDDLLDFVVQLVNPQLQGPRARELNLRTAA